MFGFIISIQFLASLAFLVIWSTIALLIRARAKSKQEKPAGILSRFVCLGVDFALINVLYCLLAYRGGLDTSRYLVLLIFFGYFFWFWLFSSSTPGKMLGGMKISSKDGLQPLKVKQVLLRLLGYFVLIFGWLWALGKEKKALHDRWAKTRVIYSEGKVLPQDRKVKRCLLILFGVFLILAVSLIVSGRGEKTAQYKETGRVKLLDVNKDKVNDVILLDFDGNGQFEIVKYDLNYDRIIDQAFYDLDGDGRTDAIDLNNDGRIDGYDLNSDSKIDKKVFKGYKFIYLKRVWFGVLGAAFLGLLVWLIILEKRKV